MSRRQTWIQVQAPVVRQCLTTGATEIVVKPWRFDRTTAQEYAEYFRGFGEFNLVFSRPEDGTVEPTPTWCELTCSQGA